MEVGNCDDFYEITLHRINNSVREFFYNRSSNIFGQLCIEAREISNDSNGGVERYCKSFSQAFLLMLIPFNRTLEFDFRRVTKNDIHFKYFLITSSYE